MIFSCVVQLLLHYHSSFGCRFFLTIKGFSPGLIVQWRGVRPSPFKCGKIHTDTTLYNNHSKIFNTIVKHRGHMIFWKHHTFVRFGIHDFYTVKFNLMSIHLTWRNWCKVAMLLKAVAQQLLSEHCGCLHTCLLWIFLLFSSCLPYLLYSLPCLFIFINYVSPVPCSHRLRISPTQALPACNT